MRAPPLPSTEEDRLADLYDYGILDTPAERIFDEIVQLAAAICGTPIGAITLIDRDRQWFKAEHGIALGQTTRDESVCGHAILELANSFEVSDTDADERFVDNPLLTGPPQIRFYSGSPLRSDRGHAIGMLCVMDNHPRELTEVQRKALQHLSTVVMTILEAGRRDRLFSWFGVLLDNIQDEILIINPRTLVYLHANRAALDHLGYTLDEIKRLTPMDVVRDPDRPKFEGYVKRLEAGEPFVAFEGRRFRGDEAYPVEARWQLLHTRGLPVILSIVQDVTERRKVERMKDEFVSVVNHELRTPLTSIHGAIKLLQQGAGGALSSQAGHLVELAAQNTQRLRGIIDDILDIEKIAAGQMHFDIGALGVRELLERAARAYEPVAQCAGVLLGVEADPAWRVRADPRRMQQVLGNLVSNALKFAPPESTVHLLADPVAEGFRLQVIDAGPGIPPEFRKRIFGRFAQADMETTRSKGGSGLGLSIAKQIVEQMGGRIGFDSRPGRTCFWVELPRESE